LIPLALAVLLTLLLSPVEGTLERKGLGRVPSVFVAVLLSLSILGGIGWTLSRQLVALPSSRSTISERSQKRTKGTRRMTGSV